MLVGELQTWATLAGQRFDAASTTSPALGAVEPAVGDTSATWFGETRPGLLDVRSRSRCLRPVGTLPTRSLLPVDVASMADADDLDDESVVEHLVNDPVVADPYPVGVSFAGHGDASRRSRVVSEKIDRGADPLLFAPGERGQSFDGAARDVDVVRRHTRPRSALTSSQGT